MSINTPPDASITALGPTSFLSGGSVVLKAPTGSGYSYQWYLNGVTIVNATGSNYTATQGGSYTVQVTANGCNAVSIPTIVTSTFALPTNNFTITATGESCKTANNGSISISAIQQLNYIATISGISTQYNFTNSLNIPNLSAGSYSVCINVVGHGEYTQCFNINITEPKDLSVYVSVNNPQKNITLTLAGGVLYQIELNGIQYATTNGEITLPIIRGSNQLKVTADKLCQGVFQQAFTVQDGILIYPNPFIRNLSINVGLDKSPTAGIEIRNINGKILYTKEVVNNDGVVILNDLPDLPIGVYILKLKLNTSESEYKILRQ